MKRFFLILSIATLSLVLPKLYLVSAHPGEPEVTTVFPSSLTWGVDQGTIVRKLGKADNTTTYSTSTGQGQPVSYERLIYNDRTFSVRKAQYAFEVDPNEGLVRALYLVFFGEGDDCERVFLSLVETFEGIRSLRKANEVKTNKLHSRPFCEALSQGKATWTAGWKHGRTDTHVTVSAGERFDDAILVLLESSEYYN